MKLRIAVMDIEGRMAQGDLPSGFEDIRAVLDDLKVIEGTTQARFRYPIELGVEERIMIRSLRLMLEGNCVAHPSYTRLVGTLNGVYGPEIEQVLNTDPHWVLDTQGTGRDRRSSGSRSCSRRLGQRRVSSLNNRTSTRSGTPSAGVTPPVQRSRSGYYLATGYACTCPTASPPMYRSTSRRGDIAGVEQKGLGREGELLGPHPAI